MEGSMSPRLHFRASNTDPQLAQPYVENLTGTRGAYKSYNTVVSKVNAWDPKVKARA